MGNKYTTACGASEGTEKGKNKMSLHKVVGGKIPPKEHKKLMTEDVVADMIDRTMNAKSENRKGLRRDCLFTPKDFGPMWVSPLIDDDMLFHHPAEINHPDICWPMSIGKLGYEYTREYGESITFNYWQTVRPEVLRGQYKFVGRKNMGFFTGFVERNGDFVAAVDYAGWDGKRWRSCRRIRYDESFMDNVKDAGMAPIRLALDAGDDDVGIRAAIGQSVALTMRYEWGAQFSVKGSPKVIVPTTPDGIFELFDDRDKPEDRDRRAALRHWVRQHIRRSKPESFSKVSAHLRGALSFTWRGYDVTVRPSQFDLEVLGK